MTIYNTTYLVDHGAHDEWLPWMKTHFIPSAIRTGLFTGYRICRLLHQDEEAGLTYVFQLSLASRDRYEEFMQHHAALLSEAVRTRFPNQCTAFHTVMELLEETTYPQEIHRSADD